MEKKLYSNCVLVLCLQKNYRQHIDQVKYSPVTDTPEIILARKNAQLNSKVRKLQRLTSHTLCMVHAWALGWPWKPPPPHLCFSSTIKQTMKRPNTSTRCPPTCPSSSTPRPAAPCPVTWVHSHPRSQITRHSHACIRARSPRSRSSSKRQSACLNPDQVQGGVGENQV